MPKIKITVIESNCRSGYHKAGDVFIVDDLCPPICHELWNNIYPALYALKNGGALDQGDSKARSFGARCPDQGRVAVKAEVVDN